MLEVGYAICGLWDISAKSSVRIEVRGRNRMLRSTRTMARRFPAIQGIKTGKKQSKGSASLEVDNVAAVGCSQINIDDDCNKILLLE